MSDKNRKVPLVTGETYHIFTKSIANYTIFNNSSEFLRAKHLLRYYQLNDVKSGFADFQRNNCKNNINHCLAARTGDSIVQIIAYCLMPTHVHLILNQLTEKGISIFMSNVLNGYTRYFNTKHKRKGPLWEFRFKNVLVKNDEQLLHLTRYLHLNPTTAYLVSKPEDWLFSSYNEYLRIESKEESICSYDDLLDIHPDSYKSFVKDGIDYQRESAKSKKQTDLVGLSDLRGLLKV